MDPRPAPERSRRRLVLDHSRWLSPLVVVLLMLASVPLVFPDRAQVFYGVLLAYVFPPGKAVIVPAAVTTLGFDPFLVATYASIVDCATGWFLAWNWDLTTRLPLLGPRILKVMQAGAKRLEGSWVAQRAGFVGLSAYVFAPVEGTGALGGTIIGRMAGMKPQRTWLAVVAGSVVSSFAWAYASEAMESLFTHIGLDALVRYALLSVAAMVAIVLVLARWRR